ncbi:transglutaminase domain-containing protein [Pontimicrobium sp. MEBiC01747]
MKTLWYILPFVIVLQSNAQLSDFGTVNFYKADSIALAYKNEGLNNLPQLSYKLTSNLNTDVEKFRAIYLWVCTNIANDYNLYLKNSRKRQQLQHQAGKLNAWNERVKKEIFRKLLKREKTICTGYAYILKELSKLANLNCVIVNGYGRTSTTDIGKLNIPNHSWNAIKLNNKWYLCDPTWASGVPDPKTNIFVFKYNNGYFLTNPELFAVNHYPIDSKWLLLNTKTPTFESFIEAPIIYSKAYTNLALHESPKKMHHTIAKDESIAFKYTLLKPVVEDNISLLINDGNNSKTIQPENTRIKNLNLSFNHQFNTTGFYDVHLYIKEDLIATYTFRVEDTK